MNFLKNFVNEYKEILTMKKTYKDTSNKTNLIIKTLSLTLIMAVVALLTALLFKTTENLGYLFTMLNMIVLGSFIIYKSLHELYIRARLKADYKIRTLLLFGSLELIILLLLSNLLIFLTLMPNTTSYFLMIIYVSLLIIFVGIQAGLETQLKNTKFHITKLLQIFKGSIYIFALYYVLAVLIAPFDFFIGTIIIYFTISLVYFYKVITNDALGYIYKRRVYFACGVFVVGIMGYSVVNSDMPIILNPLGLKVTENANQEYYGNSNIVVTDDEIINLQANKIQFYNFDLELTYTINNSPFTRIHQWGDEIVVSYYENTYVDKYYCKEATFYNIVDHQLVFREKSKVYDEGTYYYYDGNYVVGYSDDIGFIKDDCYYESLTTNNQYNENTIIEQQSNYIMVSIDGIDGIITNKDHTFRNNTPFKNTLILYSNGYILTEIDRDGDDETTDDIFLGLIEAEDFLYQNTVSQNAKVIDVGEYGSIETFYYTEDYIAISASGYSEYPYKTHTFLLDDGLLFTKESFNIKGASGNLLVSYGLNTLEIGEIDKLVYFKMTNKIQTLALVSLVVLIFTTMPLPFLKGGELDD
ncbi:hypothetical protein KQ51_01239 [Candidatus Izimaplasma bacterium HR1]|jgi:hypothetical protein|uniref:hypothetical protein n=1 Tax=Candidatus Izimoplasma sp. HR1 TaxID=1541959 RepID=UPI0004F69093|nr:hypothetical protein KQ51_01239 [Candidatus Izimaplasma bacterium HR1]